MNIRKMKRIILWTTNLSTLVFSMVFGIALLTRLYGSKYNSEGKYFDETDSVVYDQDAVLTYGTLALIFALIELISWTLTWRQKRST